MIPRDTNGIEYVLRFARNVAGRPVTAAEIGEKLGNVIFDALSREEEVRLPQRDQWGNWDWSQAATQSESDQRVPWLDVRLAEHLDIRSHRPQRWPEGKRFALCLTHDVDSVSRRRTAAASVVESARRLRGDGSAGDRLHEFGRSVAKYALQIPRLRGRPDPLWHYEDWLTLESEHGFRSTFFAFPGRVAKPHAWDANYRMHDLVVFDGVRMTAGEMFRRIADRGWEIGLHGSYHSATNAAILADERAQIEAVTQSELYSVRQHYLHYDASTTPAVHHAAGLRADSTQGFNSGVGFRAGTSLPYWCWNWPAGGVLPVLEVPQHIMDGALLHGNATSAAADTGIARVVKLIDEVEAVGGCLTLSWHPEYLNLPAYWDVYRTALQEAGRRRAWGCSVRELYEWWTQRERALDAAFVPAIRPSSREPRQ